MYHLTVEEGVELFRVVPAVYNKLETLRRVGLGYIRIGQQATTLSGGEAQRVKLAKELSRRSTGRTLYILDEPTTGLHFEDVRKLLELLHAPVDAGSTVIVIEETYTERLTETLGAAAWTACPAPATSPTARSGTEGGEWAASRASSLFPARILIEGSGSGTRSWSS